MPMTGDDIKAMIEYDPELVCDLILKLMERIEQLEKLLAKDSHNSSKLPFRQFKWITGCFLRTYGNTGYTPPAKGATRQALIVAPQFFAGLNLFFYEKAIG